MTSIAPMLWFDTELEEAVDFYTSVFPDSKVHSLNRKPDGTLFTADFELAGFPVKGLNAGPHDKFNDAVSFYVSCADQEEVDRYWNALTADGGQETQCGWLKDKFGVSWQVTPTVLTEMLQDEDRQRADRVMQAMLQMGKIDIAALERAYAGKE